MAGLGAWLWTPRDLTPRDEPYARAVGAVASAALHDAGQTGQDDGVLKMLPCAGEQSESASVSTCIGGGSDTMSVATSADSSEGIHTEGARRIQRKSSFQPLQQKIPQPSAWPPPKGYTQACAGWHTSALSKEWLYRPANGLFYHTPSNTLWKRAQGDRTKFVRVDASGLRSVATAARGRTPKGRRTLLRTCFEGWYNELKIFEHMDKELASACEEARMAGRPRTSAPGAGLTHETNVPDPLQPPATQFQQFLTDPFMIDSCHCAVGVPTASREAISERACSVRPHDPSPNAVGKNMRRPRKSLDLGTLWLRGR